MVLAPLIPCPVCGLRLFTPGGLDAHLVNHRSRNEAADSTESTAWERRNANGGR